jgi:lysozyme
MRTGIDVSAWQGKIDWAKAQANGAAFAFIKSSQQLFSDRCFPVNWQGARSAGLPRGAYHYLTWDAPSQSQARFFSRLLKNDPGELSPVVDFEETAGCPGDAAALLGIFMEEVEAALGRSCMVYTSPGFWQAHGNRDPFFAKRPLWLAHWGVGRPSVPQPWNNYTFWQFTNKGDGPAFGVSSRGVDCSYANDLALLSVQAVPVQSAVSLPSIDQLARLWAAHPELH